MGRRSNVRRIWIARALWLVVAAAVGVRLGVTLSQPISVTGQPTSAGYFLDFRDTVWWPGRYLLDGGNPYDPDTYLAEHPWALPFSLYTPAFLLFGVVLAPLPFIVSVALFQVISLAIAFVMLRVIWRWALPKWVDVAVPATLLWMNIWYPGRGTLSVQVGSLLAVLGVVLVLRSLTSPDERADDQPRRRRRLDAGAAVGVALGLIKAQFGLILLAALAGGRHREVWRGVAGLALISLPVVIACSFAAGGPAEFVQSVVRDIQVLSSDAGPTGLSNPGQRRLDLLGQVARYGLVHPPGWLEPLILVLAAVAVVGVVRISRDPLVLSTVICTAILLGYYHGTYDLILLLVPVAVGIGRAVRRELVGPAQWIMAGSLTLVVLHLQTVSTSLLPGFDYRVADTVNLVLMMVALAAGLYAAVTARTRTARETVTV